MVEQELRLSQMFHEATSLHEKGQLSEAGRLYRSILEVDPTHFGCLHQLGILLAQQGKLDGALGLLRRALAQDATCAEAHHLAGRVLHAMKRFEDAIACFGRALAIDHEYDEAYCNRGVALQALGQVGPAVLDYEAALAIDPAYFLARYNLGTALQALDRHEEAIAQYRKALAIEPDHAPAHTALGAALSACGRREEALAEYEKAVAINDSFVPAHEGLGMALQSLNRHAEAIASYERALAIGPQRSSTLNRLGGALQALQRYEEAVAVHLRALALNASDASAHNNLGLALQNLNRHNEAIEHHRAALSLQPDLAAAHNNLGMALQALNRHDEAIEEYGKAIGTSSVSAERYANLGLALQETGRIEDACGAFTRAIELAPRNGKFYRNLADCKQFTVGDPQLAAMDELVKEIDSLPVDDRKQLLFALGKAYADLGMHQRSFGYILQGNALKRRHIDYDEAAMLAEFERIQSVFNPDLMARRQGAGDPSSVPVFILGMPRSGTTLAEQMLASHSKVFGAGELTDFRTLVSRLRGPGGAAETFPELVPSLADEQLRQLGTNYVASITSGAPGVARITDKMPLNFYYIGLIHLALPNARIIHTRRDPVDTCFSCFSTLFTGVHRVAYELAELGRYYRAYERLMEHWRSVVPPGVMIEVQYEDMVTNFEREARRLVAHCGLEWEDACLRFNETRRAVRTASVAQVRRPIYQTSVGRWQPYEELLRPLLDALEEDSPGAARQT